MNETGLSTVDYNLKQPKDKKALGDELTKIASYQLAASDSFKKPRMQQWKDYEDLKVGKVKKKLRTPFQVAFPIFSGMLDTLAASFDEPIELEFYPTKPADFFKSQKIQGAWNTEKTKNSVNAMWDYKSRVDKNLALVTGRGVQSLFSESKPTFKTILEIIDPVYFHSQPLGGGKLENHLFCGREDIFRSEADIQASVDSGEYDKNQWDELKVKSADPSYQIQAAADLQAKLMRFKALGLNPESNNYVGERIYNLVQWTLTYKSERWYLLFDPYTLTWLRCEKLKDLFSLGLYPYTSWATHEDAKVFWSKSYGDDLFPIADAVTTLFNQELTNREKRNYGARAYDKDMVPDVAKLDQAQYRPDALVPIDTKGGARRLDQAVYHFETPELQGTINLLDWVQKSTQKDTGITDIAQGAAMQATKKVNVAYMEQSSVAKRIGHKSQSYSECWGEVGVRYVQGLKDHMSGKMAIQTIGDMGLEWDEVTRDDLDLEGDIGVRVVSSTARKEEAMQKKAGRSQAIELIAKDPTIAQTLNPQWKAQAILRDVGNYDDDEIKEAMDTKNFASRESVARAHVAIQEIISKREPEVNFNANSIFLKVLRDYAFDHRATLTKRKYDGQMNQFEKIMSYMIESAKIAAANSGVNIDQGNKPNQNPGQPQPNAQPTPSPMGVAQPQTA
jgi:hypothetical protein